MSNTFSVDCEVQFYPDDVRPSLFDLSERRVEVTLADGSRIIGRIVGQQNDPDEGTMDVSLEVIEVWKDGIRIEPPVSEVGS